MSRQEPRPMLEIRYLLYDLNRGSDSYYTVYVRSTLQRHNRPVSLTRQLAVGGTWIQRTLLRDQGSSNPDPGACSRSALEACSGIGIQERDCLLPMMSLCSTSRKTLCNMTDMARCVSVCFIVDSGRVQYISTVQYRTVQYRNCEIHTRCNFHQNVTQLVRNNDDSIYRGSQFGVIENNENWEIHTSTSLDNYVSKSMHSVLEPTRFGSQFGLIKNKRNCEIHTSLNFDQQVTKTMHSVNDIFSFDSQFGKVKNT